MGGWNIGMLESWKADSRKVGKFRSRKVRSKKVGKLGLTKLESWKVKPGNIGKCWKISTEDLILATVQVLVRMMNIEITVAECYYTCCHE